jgi:hypothetical protein
MDVEREAKVLENINEEVLGERVQVNHSTQALGYGACGINRRNQSRWQFATISAAK